jgi:hypothetical protein
VQEAPLPTDYLRDSTEESDSEEEPSVELADGAVMTAVVGTVVTKVIVGNVDTVSSYSEVDGSVSVVLDEDTPSVDGASVL